MTVTQRTPQIHALIQSHFDPTPVGDLTVTERQFPHRVRADFQRAVDQVFGGRSTVSFFCGVRKSHAFEGISFSELLVRDRNNPAQSVPPLFEEIDVGEEQPVRCLKNGLWLLESGGTKFAVFLEQNTKFGQVQGLRVQVATANDPQGFRLSQDFLKRLEEAVQQGRVVPGQDPLAGGGPRLLGAVVGHPGPQAGPGGTGPGHPARPAPSTCWSGTWCGSSGSASSLSGLGLATKKGLLFYGPPGTGKTHTIHYLAGALKGHTTLLITAEQVGLLGEYMALARLLQPSIVVIEDVDLIARDRTDDEQPVRGGSAEQAAERDGRAAAGLGDPVRPDDEPARGPGSRPGVEARPGGPGDRVPSARRGGPHEAGAAVRQGRGGARGSRAR